MSFQSLVPHIIGQTPFLPLAHLGESIRGVIGAIRSPSFFSDEVAGTLFDSHWLWWLAIVAVGAVLYFAGRSRADKNLFALGLGAIGVAIAWTLLALTFDSPSERLYAAHKGLAQAAADHDIDRMLTFLSKDFLAPQVGITADAATRDELNSRLNSYGIRSTYIRSFRFTRQNAIAVTDVTLLTESNMGAIPTTWQLSWNDVPGEDWKIVRANLLKISDQPVPRDLIIP